MSEQVVEDLPLLVESEDGQAYVIEPFVASVENIQYLWDNAGKYRFLFQDNHRGDFGLFMNYVLSPQVLMTNVKVIEDDGPPVGLLYADNIMPRASARAHYIFWDRKQAGRHRVLLSGAKWLISTFDLVRVSIEIPEVAFSALRRMQKMGVRLEGRRRAGFLYEGNWADVFEFGILREELTPEALEEGRLYRTPEEDKWFGVMEEDSRLMRAIVTKGGRNGRIRRSSESRG